MKDEIIITGNKDRLPLLPYILFIGTIIQDFALYYQYTLRNEDNKVNVVLKTQIKR